MKKRWMGSNFLLIPYTCWSQLALKPTYRGNLNVLAWKVNHTTAATSCQCQPAESLDVGRQNWNKAAKQSILGKIQRLIEFFRIGF